MQNWCLILGLTPTNFQIPGGFGDLNGSRDFWDLRKKLERISKDFRQFSEWFQESHTMKENKV